jgi:hypothetical protein
MYRDYFYITLFSNAYQDIYSDNKISGFTTQFAQPIKLDPSEIWEVGLYELSYSANLQQLQLLDFHYFVNALIYCDLSATAHRHH